jgi:hypothetical protein
VGPVVAHPAFSRAIWNTADVDVLGHKRWSQLWRNHLLARAESQALGLSEPTVLVVHHPADPHCADTVRRYQGLLTDPSLCQAIDVGTVVAILRHLVGAGTLDDQWLTTFEERYLRLDLSESTLSLPGFRYESEAKAAGLLG